jgi:hypothetical protein
VSDTATKRSKYQATKPPALHLVHEKEPAAEWADYLRIEPGEYAAYCKRAKWYWEPGFKRWTCILLFDALANGSQRSLGTVPIWFNGGKKAKPYAGRRSLYLSAWVEANGGPPARRDRLGPSVFVRRMARVQVGDTMGPIPYSVVRKILQWSTGTPVNPSHSQERHQ